MSRICKHVTVFLNAAWAPIIVVCVYASVTASSLSPICAVLEKFTVGLSFPRNCSCACVRACMRACVLALVPGYLHDNYLSSSVITFTSEQSATMAANDKQLGLVRALTHTDTQSKMPRIAHRGVCAFLCFPSARLNRGF